MLLLGSIAFACGGKAERENPSTDKTENTGGDGGSVGSVGGNAPSGGGGTGGLASAGGGGLSTGGLLLGSGGAEDVPDDLFCCPTCERSCDHANSESYALSLTAIWETENGQATTDEALAIEAGDEVVVEIEVADNEGYVHVGLVALAESESVVIEPASALFYPQCSTLAFGASGPNLFKVIFSSDLTPGTVVEFAGFGTVVESDVECLGPIIEFEVTLQ